MKRVYLLALAACVPVLAYAAGGTARSVFDAVPPIPQTAQAAYAQWIDNQGDLKPGATFKSLEDTIQNAELLPMQANAPSAQQQASAQAMAAQYSSPEAQARLRNMTPAQAMAMAQQMQAQMGYAAPAPTTVSDHDGAILRQLGGYGKAGEIMQKSAAIRMASSKVQQQWTADRDALGQQEIADRNKLPVCAGEAGEPSSRGIRELSLKYADRRIALANSYAPKFANFLQQLKQNLAPDVDHGDNAVAQFAKLENPALKTQMQSTVTGARGSAYGDAGTVLSYVEEISKSMAAEMADRKRIERDYFDAKGCEG